MLNSRKSKNLKKAYLVIFIFLLIGLVYLGFRTWKYLAIGVQVVTNNKIELKQTQQRRINILLLGIGGGTHDGPNLTDTIIFTSIDPNTKRALLFSLPRDLWIPELSAKINSAYQDGEDQQKGSGLLMTKGVVQKILGQQIDYVIKIDFDGFIKAVDMIGGLDVNVDNSFTDNAYPVTGKETDLCGHDDTAMATISAQIATGSATEYDFFPCRYEQLKFTSGLTHMDGTTALKYVRSRHALGPEGSDFARSKRQEKVIAAFKDKIFSLSLLLNPAKVIDLINIVKGSIETDIAESEYDDFIRLAQKFRDSKITSAVIDTGDESAGRSGLLMNPPIGPTYANQWVLIPSAGNGDYSEIQKYVECEIKDACPKPTPEKSPSP